MSNLAYVYPPCICGHGLSKHHIEIIGKVDMEDTDTRMDRRSFCMLKDCDCDKFKMQNNMKLINKGRGAYGVQNLQTFSKGL